MHGILYLYLAIIKMIYRCYPGNYDEKIYSLLMYIIGKWCFSSNLGIWYKATDQLNFAIKMPFDKVYSEICMYLLTWFITLFMVAFFLKIDLEKCTRNGSTWCWNRWWKRYKFVCKITFVWNYCLLIKEVDQQWYKGMTKN